MIPLGLALGLIALLAILKPINMDVAFAAAFLYQIYVPMRMGYVARFERSKLKSDLWRVFAVSALTLPLFGLFYGYYLSSHGFTFAPAFSSGLLSSIVINGLMIAVPEEIFYRGFLQSSLLKSSLRGGKADVAICFLSINLLFALGHLVGEYDPSRLLPFFPGLVFSWLAYRSGGSLTGPVIYHTLCNVYSEWLNASWTTSPY